MGEQREVGRHLRLHLRPEELLQQPDVFHDGVDLVAVEGEGLLQLVEDAHEIQNEAVRLHHLRRLVFIGTVHPRDGLEQRVVAHRLVQIHRVEDRRIEAGEQLFGNDEDFRRLLQFREILPDRSLPLLVDMPLLQVRRVVVIPRENDFGILGRQDCIKRLFVERTRLAVHRHEERLVAERLDVFPIVIGDEPRHLLHALLSFEEIFQIHRALEDFVQLLDVGDTLRLGQREEFRLHDLVRHEHFVRREVVVERQRGAVFDALGD